MAGHRVLIVDDEQPIRKILRDFLVFRDFEVEEASGADEALERMRAREFDLVLSDVRMPGKSGIELLQSVSLQYPETGVVLLTGCDDVKLAVQAMNSGALDYILKPFHVMEVAQTLEKALARRSENLDRERHVRRLESDLREQTVKLRNTLADLRDTSEGALEALVAALDAREHETQAHSKRVSDYCTHLAAAMGVTGEDLDNIRRGAMLHDIGKIGISDTILLKPGVLTEPEWVEMRKHPRIGHWIVSGLHGLKAASEVVLAHHERYDGRGYPDRLAGERIPLGARIFSVVDSLDAMTSDRPYHRGRRFEEAREEIARNASTQFDPAVVQRFLEISPDVWHSIRARNGRGHQIPARMHDFVFS